MSDNFEDELRKIMHEVEKEWDTKKREKKKYWVYTAAWRYSDQSVWNYTTGLHCGSATSLYEKMQKDPNVGFVVSLTNIDAEEYSIAKDRCLIGRLD